MTSQNFAAQPGVTPTVSRPIDRALDVLAEKAETEELRSLSADIRNHRQPISALLKVPEFSRLSRKGYEAFQQMVDNMTPEEKKALHDQGLAIARKDGVIAYGQDPYALPWEEDAGNVD